MTILIYAIATMLRGQGIWPHWFYTIFMAIMLFSTMPWERAVAMYWVVFCLTIIPTNTLLSAIHGRMPGRKDGRWQFLQAAAIRVTNYLPPRWCAYDVGIAYGTLKALLALPAMIYVNPWLCLLLGQGMIYFACGKLKARQVNIAEGITGALLGGGV